MPTQFASSSSWEIAADDAVAVAHGFMVVDAARGAVKTAARSHGGSNRRLFVVEITQHCNLFSEIWNLQSGI